MIKDYIEFAEYCRGEHSLGEIPLSYEQWKRREERKTIIIPRHKSMKRAFRRQMAKQYGI